MTMTRTGSLFLGLYIWSFDLKGRSIQDLPNELKQQDKVEESVCNQNTAKQSPKGEF